MKDLQDLTDFDSKQVTPSGSISKPKVLAVGACGHCGFRGTRVRVGSQPLPSYILSLRFWLISQICTGFPTRICTGYPLNGTCGGPGSRGVRALRLPRHACACRSRASPLCEVTLVILFGVVSPLRPSYTGLYPQISSRTFYPLDFG